ncbi:MAG: Chemotaxis response regulator protein-glutamate methylesterase/glutamine deamidase [Nitrosopumilus sp.]|nr:Chemotaxis response regulator protein-glutamate methylesterase/glutamine deamidase [Nitrosopumilus sp.]
MSSSISVFVVNDSAYMTNLISDIVKSADGMHVCGTAMDGNEAMTKIHLEKPHVILTDLEMPHMDGLSLIQNILAEDLIPIIVVSSYAKEGAKIVFDALEFGAVDYTLIPENIMDITSFSDELINKINIANHSNPVKLITNKISSFPKKTPVILNDEISKTLVVIGSSTGGPSAVSKVFETLPGELPACILLVQHMSKGFTLDFARRLDKICPLHVKEAQTGDKIRDGTVLVAPGDFHMIVNPDGAISLVSETKRYGVRPSVNKTMISGCEHFGINTIGVIMTGMGHDGAFGMKSIKKRGGKTIAQDEDSSVVFGMAKSSCELKAVDKLVSLENISSAIVRTVNDNV